MQIKIVNDGDGCPAVSVVNPNSNETLESVELGLNQNVTIDLPNAHEATDVVVGEVTDNDPANTTDGAGESA
jgi:hypothetical protein